MYLSKACLSPARQHLILRGGEACLARAPDADSRLISAAAMEERASSRSNCTAHTLAIAASVAALCVLAVWNWGPAGVPVPAALGRAVGGTEVAAQSMAAAPKPGVPTALEAMAACESFACLRKERRALPEPTPFSFPHLMILGFAKR